MARTRRSSAWVPIPWWYQIPNFAEIAVDHTVEFARVLRASSPDAAFSFLSGGGADPTRQSPKAFAPRFKDAYLDAIALLRSDRHLSFGRGAAPFVVCNRTQ